MKLADWLAWKKVTRTDFAARIGVTPALITSYCNGSVWPGRLKMEAVRRETDGAVTANDFMQSAAAATFGDRSVSAQGAAE